MGGLGEGRNIFWMILVWGCLTLLAKESEAMPCTISQEADPQTGRYRWLIQAVDPCECTVIGMGGLNTFVPYRPYKVTYYDTFLISSNHEEVQRWIDCSGAMDFSCSEERPLGMEDGRIPDDSITASSYWQSRDAYTPPMARLNTGSATAWSNSDHPHSPSPWIQVDFNGKVTITGLITQGRGVMDQWVTEYEVTYSDDAQSWDLITDAESTPLKFPGNEDRNTMVTTRFLAALRTRILRIIPTSWNNYCSMRFEVIGC